MTTLISNFYNLPAFMSQGPLNLTNCHVTGSNPDRSIGALAFRGGMTVTGTTFSSLKHGIVTYDRFNTITSNVFEDCREGIFQGGGGPNSVIPLDVTTTLTCNRFERGSTFSGTKYGLYIEDGVLMNDIGGDPNGGQNKSPNANVFPTQGARPGTRYDINNPGSWVVPSDFVAVRFPSTSSTLYFSYDNEFVGSILPSVNNLNVVSTLACYTSANPQSNPSPNEIEVCSSLGSSVVYFPLRVGQTTSLNPSVGKPIRVYPNPVRDMLTVNVGNQDIDQLVLTDVLGRTQNLIWQASDTGYTTTLTKLVPGVYYLKFNGQLTRIVKQ